MKLERPGSLVLDALREVCTVGGGHAATALAQMTGRRIAMEVPRVFVASLADVPALLGGPESPVVGILQELHGDSDGIVLLALSSDDARAFARRLGATDPDDPSGDLSEMGRAALCEAANIISGAFLTAAARLIKLTVVPQVPLLAEDMAGSIIDTVLCDIGSQSDFAFVMETQFHDAGGPYRGLLLLIPSLKSLRKWVEALEGA
ncbi:MAG: chemotaxis protein CheC [Deltaproteobacteria bacterium]|nr:chemotaxis protein CheC [Deltaproteobacteria bacterium]